MLVDKSSKTSFRVYAWGEGMTSFSVPWGGGGVGSKLKLVLVYRVLVYFCINQETKGFFFQFEVIINTLVSSFSFIRIHMLNCFGFTAIKTY